MRKSTDRARDCLAQEPTPCIPPFAGGGSHARPRRRATSRSPLKTDHFFSIRVVKISSFSVNSFLPPKSQNDGRRFTDDESRRRGHRSRSAAVRHSRPGSAAARRRGEAIVLVAIHVGSESQHRIGSPIFLVILRGQEHMGMIDQRGQRRRVVCDGQPQAQGQAPDERGIAGEQRGIRLLPDSAAGRAPGRIATVSGRPIPTAEGADQGPGSDSEAGLRTTADQGQTERSRRLRCDDTHASPSSEPRGSDGRAPGPLRARIALRHSRDTSGRPRSVPEPPNHGPTPVVTTRDRSMPWLPEPPVVGNRLRNRRAWGRDDPRPGSGQDALREQFQ